ncbi:Leishmanolysin-like peptidase [Symbiodinium microadriaticum]|uniref:Leishmanolysin-like peptidase n=1 Tax=Symbiodinium microadriaticum TaxID=2951 RepID=A0A1Q9CXQ7_SYMMI|nr:Leishmanolysin-like peptidase [Symbiodinium microadriaticum]
MNGRISISHWLLLSVLLGAPEAHGPDNTRYLHFDRTRVHADTFGSRRLKEAAWQPIRINLDTSALEAQVNSEQLSYLRDDVLHAASRWLTNVVQVLPVEGSLRYEQPCAAILLGSGRCARLQENFQECGPVTIPREHFADKEVCPSGCQVSSGGAGIPNADLAIYVAAAQTQWCSGNTVAYASTCRQAEDDRPLAGYFNFCPNRLSPASERNWHQDVAVAIHEILHSMAFSSSLFPFFRDVLGAPRTPRDEEWGLPPMQDGMYRAGSSTVRVEQADGLERHFIALPKVVQAARQHFDCPSLLGVALEEQGGDGSAFSHWDARIMHSEVMAAESSAMPRISEMTLALLEDSGWYRVLGGLASPDADSAAGHFVFGRGKGCSFLQHSCIIDRQSAFPDTFCTESQGSCTSPSAGGAIGCSHDHLSLGACTNCLHSSALPTRYQHFDNPRLGGIARYIGYCPTVEPFWFSGRPTTCASSGVYSDRTSQRFGESHGPASRCVLSTATQSGFVPPDEPQGTCRDVFCLEDALRIRISENNFVLCGKEETGVRKRVSGQFAGFIQCPGYAAICGESGRQGPQEGAECHFPGTHRHGRCVCAPGSMGEDCSVPDTAANRQDFPFGLHYPQQEFELKVGLELSRTEGLRAWPMRPTLQSRPRLLQFKVDPALPAGLSLNGDGELRGTPAASSDRKSFVITAYGWSGASTTVLFITVLCDSGADCPTSAPESVTPAGSVTTSLRGSSGSGPSDDDAAANSMPKLRLTLSSLDFRQLQKDPGLESFALQLQAALSETMSLQTANVVVSAAVDGTVLVDLDLSTGQEGLRMLEDSLQGQLADPASPLLSSTFGQTYLQSVKISSLSLDGSRQVWPLPSDEDGDDGFMEYLDYREWQDWFSSQTFVVQVAILGGASVVIVLCCLAICKKVCCCKKSEPERAALTEWGGTLDTSAMPTAPASWAMPSPTSFGNSMLTASPDQAMEQMLAMGFSFEASKVALETNRWDVSRASTAILEAAPRPDMDVQVESATDSEISVHMPPSPKRR